MSEDYVETKLEQMEAIIGEIRTHLKGETKKIELPFDENKINWTDAVDKKDRPYRMATIQNNLNNVDFQAAKKLLMSGGGQFRQKDGVNWLLFESGDAIGVWDYKKKVLLPL